MVNKNLISYITQEWRYIVISIFSSVVETVAIILECWLIAKIVNHVFLLEGQMQEVERYFWFLLITIVLRLLGNYASEHFAQFAAASVQKKIREKILNHIHNLSPLQIKKDTATKVMNLFVDGVDRFKDWYAYYLPYLIKAILIPIIYLAFTFPLDYISGIIMVITLPLIPLFMILIGTWTKKVSEQQWTLLESLTGYLKDVLQGLETLKLMGRSHAQGHKIAAISERYRKTTLSVQKWAFTSSLALELVSTLSIAVVAVNLGIRLVSGNIDFFDAFFILLIIPEYYFPMRRLGGFFHSSLDADAAEKALELFFNQRTEQGLFGHKEIGPISSITFKNVCYTYPGSHLPAVENISFHLAQGTSLALVGASGSGKSTVLALALGFLEPDSGEILINGDQRANLSRVDYLNQIAYIPQKPHFLKASIYANIGAGEQEDEKRAVDAFIKEMKAENVFSSLPKGLETLIGQDGTTLSGGQEELVAFLRALYLKQNYFFLDEATESLDVQTEKCIVEMLSRILKDKTALIIAHRLSTIKDVDHIIHLEQGRIVEEGSYKDLKSTSEFFMHILRDGEHHEQ